MSERNVVERYITSIKHPFLDNINTLSFILQQERLTG